MNQLGLAVAMIREALDWKSLLDILFITMALFFAYNTLNRLKTWKILFGIFLLVITLMLAQILELTGVRWIYSNLSNVALLGSIVVFQPEIRKMFERVASLRGGRLAGKRADSSDLIAEAAFAMGCIRQGALLVLPGKEPVEPWLAGGIALNGELSVPILMSIFDHHSAGHDGAVTIENGRIGRFALRLPLSESEDLKECYGTRHHAAMGLCEVTDALVIAVSEERGSVSVFQNGKAEWVQTDAQLRQKIFSHGQRLASFKSTGAGQQSRWARVAEVAFGVTVACMIWATIIISQGEIIQKGLTVPVTFTGLPSDLTLVDDKLGQVNLLLGGAKSELDAVKPSQISVKIDLSHADRGRHRYLITQDNVKLPAGIKLLGAEPSLVSARLEKLVTRAVKVRPKFVGKLPAGLRLLSAKVEPAKVLVRCPANLVERAGLEVSTAPIDLSKIHQDAKLHTQIAAPPECQPVKKDWPDIKIAISLAPHKPG